jgi:hypothetical protein
MHGIRFAPIPLILALGVVLAGCSETNTPTALSPESELLASSHAAQAQRNFRTHMTADEEVAAVPVVSSGQGQTIFQLSRDGTELSYRMIVANIENVTMAHIHRAPAGVNGPVVAWLYPSSPPAQLIEGRVSGVIATGTITAANLVGQLAGQPLSALIDEIRAGNTYVNVHTLQYPAGEIRGQIW